MKRWSVVLLLVASFCVVPVLSALGTVWDFTLGGSGYHPGNATTFTVSSTAIGTTACGPSGNESPALLYVFNAPIWFTVNAPSGGGTATGTPLSSDFQGGSGDQIVVQNPSLLRMIAVGNDAKVKIQCLTR